MEAVEGPLTLRMAGGTRVRLAGLHMPDFDPAAPGPWALEAQALLREMLEGREVALYGEAENRMGHLAAHVVVGGNWVQGALLSQGLAQVRTTADDARLATEMLAAENRGAGVWADYPVLTPETIAKADLHAFRVVEGVVHGVAERGSVTYVNFGPDWRTDLTLAIPDAAARRRFADAGVDPKGWAGRRVQARGWLRSYNGPYMEIDHPQAVAVRP